MKPLVANPMVSFSYLYMLLIFTYTFIYSRLLQSASLGDTKGTHIILSSGSRQATTNANNQPQQQPSEDMGTFALRTPSDLMNWMQVVFKMDAQAAFQALHTSATFALEQAHMRRFGGTHKAKGSMIIPVEGLSTSSMTVEGGGGDDDEGTLREANAKDKKKPRKIKRTKAVSASASEKDKEDQHAEDGFIAF